MPEIGLEEDSRVLVLKQILRTANRPFRFQVSNKDACGKPVSGQTMDFLSLPHPDQLGRGRRADAHLIAQKPAFSMAVKRIQEDVLCDDRHGLCHRSQVGVGALLSSISEY